MGRRWSSGRCPRGGGRCAIALVLLPVLLELRRSRGPARLDAVPVIVAACAVAVCGGAHPVGRVADVPVGVTDALRAVTGVAALVTPLALLATVLQGGRPGRRWPTSSCARPRVRRSTGCSARSAAPRRPRRVLAVLTRLREGGAPRSA
jgi:hypothetical protein